MNEIHVDAPPERVFAVLADWRAYPSWVVGTHSVRGVDPGFPAAGTRFHHTVGPGPLKVNDHSEVLEVDPPRRLVLRAKARPLFGTATVDLTLEDAGDGGTRVVMREDPGDRLSALVFTPLTHVAVRGRNTKSLSRLKDIAENRPDLGADVKVQPGKVER